MAFKIRLSKTEHWNRCDSCGRFISYEDFATGKGKRKLTTPDSLCTKETYETLCKNCNT